MLASVGFGRFGLFDVASLLRSLSTRYWRDGRILLGVVLLCLNVRRVVCGGIAEGIVIGVDGGTESIRACCFNARSGEVVGKSCAVPYVTSHPKPGWAEQNPEDWYANLGKAVRDALDSVGEEDVRSRVRAICLDTTCCSVVALDKKYTPLRPCLLWMDARSSAQTKEILDKCRGDDALQINCDGEGPLSAEWMLPKSLWIRQQEPNVWKRAMTICEYQDYLNYKLTGKMVASSCNAAVRWHWDGEACLEDDPEKYPGRPMSLYRTLGIPELAQKLPQKCLPMGAVVGHLTSEAAKHLSLPEGLLVAQGGPDAFVGMIGLGCIHPGQLCLITGSSHLHCVVTLESTTAPGTWGAYRGAPLPGLNFAEGGQSSTGSIVRWARSQLFASADGTVPDYKTLDKEAAQVRPGCDGLVALETFQGSRTPVTDPLARGALAGLTLSHTRAHLWRALLEAVCFGTRACIESLAAAGHDCQEIIMAGGITRSSLWLQMHADVTGKPVVLTENADAPLLGCAILAAVGAGIHDSVPNAVQAMVRPVKRIAPQKAVASAYQKLYDKVYSPLSPALRPIAHALDDLRGGASAAPDTGRSSLLGATRLRNKASAALRFCGGAIVDHNDKDENNESTARGSNDTGTTEPPNGPQDVNAGNECSAHQLRRNTRAVPSVIVSPSLLAADWSKMGHEVQRCVHAGASRLHVDVFDGVFLDSPRALTFGPQMISAIRRHVLRNSAHTQKDKAAPVELDIHLCVTRPERFVTTLAEAGANVVIFQWEAMKPPDSHTAESQEMRRLMTEASLAMAKQIRENGMKCGISLNPETRVEDVLEALDSGWIDVVDILAVEPGFGGQAFQPSALVKLRQLVQWREQDFPQRGKLQFMVDGGVNAQTAKRILEAGANVLVAGTFLFQHPVSIEKGIQELLSFS